MTCYSIKRKLVHSSFFFIFVIAGLITYYLITIQQPIGYLKALYNTNILKLHTQTKSINVIQPFKCKDDMKIFYNKSFIPNNNLNLLKTLELFYINYEIAFKIKPAVNRKDELYRNGLFNVFKILMKQKSVVSSENNEIGFVDLGIENFGLYTLAAASLGYQVVAVSSDFCTSEILKLSLKNISKNLDGCTPLKKITFLYKSIRQVSCIKIPNALLNCDFGYSVHKINEATHQTTIRLSDILLSYSFKILILFVDLQFINFSIFFDDLKNILVFKYNIPTMILTNWNKMNKSTQNQLSRLLRELCYTPHLSPTISAKMEYGFPWPNEFYWSVSPVCNVKKLTNHIFLANTDIISNSNVNCLEFFPINNEVERLIEQNNFHLSNLNTKWGIIPIYIHDPQVDKMISGIIDKKKLWGDDIFDQIIMAIQERSDLHYIDIGVNIGALALPVAVVTKRNVIGIDANSDNLLRLSKSAKLNKLNSLYLFRNAITGFSCEKMQISINDKNNLASWSVVSFQNNENSFEYFKSEIKSATIDNIVPILSSLGIKQAVLKIDIEGQEYSSLHSASELFKRIDIPYLFFEWGFYGDYDGSKVQIPYDKSSEKFKQQQFLKEFFISLGYMAYSDIYSKKPYVGDQPRTWDIVFKKTYL
jgi:FkbM family methyltransferase